MPRKSPAHDSRVITYRTLPGSSPQYQRVNVGECTAWVQTKLAFDLEEHGTALRAIFSNMMAVSKFGVLEDRITEIKGNARKADSAVPSCEFRVS
jgi:hypothetical protein